MFKSIVWLSISFAFAFFAGPLVFVASQAGKPDPLDLYILIDAGAPSANESHLASMGATDVGPMRGMFAKMVHAPPIAHAQIMQLGYFMLPASALAALCLTAPNQSTSQLRNK